MSSEIIGRILQRTKDLKLSPRAASLASGMNDGAIRDLLRKPGMSPTMETLEKLAVGLQTTSRWLAYGDGEPDAAQSSSLATVSKSNASKDDFVLASYGGIAEATAFRPGDDIVDPDRGPELVPRDERYPRGDYVLFDVVGDSMNAADPPIAPGSRVISIRVDNPNRPIALQTGDIVVVRRTQQQGGLIELSVKELELGEAETRYLPRSRSGRHQPIVVPKDLKSDDETVVEVVGLVIDVMTKVRRR